MYGALLGDMIGQPYEFAPIKKTDFLLLGRHNRYTDDSVMTVAVAAALLDLKSEVDASDERIEETLVQSLQAFGRAHPDAGYGGRFRQWLASAEPKPYHSYGNGSAMRVSPVAWFYPDSLGKAVHVAGLTAKITHNHPEGIKAAEAATAAIWLANDGADKDEIFEHVNKNYYKLRQTCDEIRPDYQFDVSAQGTMPAAFAAFFEGGCFEEVIRLGVSLGGDSDTIGAIAGGMAEAYYGVPHHLKMACRRKLPVDMLKVLLRFDQMLLERDRCI